jgi:predicted site-specific integrase-resolvase
MALVKIGKAAELLGVEVKTLRRWEASGELIPDRKSAGGVRYYDLAKILGLGNEDAPTIGYARVSSHDQKSDLERQAELLEAFCAAKGWRFEISARLYGSRSNKTKRLLEAMREGGEPPVIRKGMVPADHPDEATRHLLESLDAPMMSAMLFYREHSIRREKVIGGAP